jgi:MFS family permease
MQKDFPSISTFSKEIFVSLALLGAAFGCLSSVLLADRLGRKASIILSDIFMIMGPLLMWGTSSMMFLLLGRLITGFGFGINLLVSSIFMSETVPSRVRNKIVSSY